MASEDNKRIARNSAFLYFRMLFLALINLVTVSVTLKALGDIDYGIYTVVGSLVATLGFLTGTLTSATQRFFSFHLGKKDFAAYSRTFSLLLMGFIAIGIAAFVIAEPLGYFFIDDWLDIPADRLYAAKWVFQTTVVTFILNLIIIPYSSSIVANEKMNAFAYISIADGIFKLLLVYLLYTADSDRLIFYSILTLLETAIVLLLNALYCRRAIPYCKFKFVWDKAIFKELTTYTGWNLFGSISAVLSIQGQSILLNIYFGPIVNAAKGIADRISNTVNNFSGNFYMAVNPQIIKSYASGDFERMMTLALTSSRLAYFLLLAISFPLIMAMQPLLVLWLGARDVTPNMVGFSQLALIHCLVFSIEQPVTQIIRATGNLRKYQLRVGIWTLMYLPIAALTLWAGASAISTMIVLIAITAFVQIIRVRVAHQQIGLKYGLYLHQVVIPICLTSAICALIYIITEPFIITASLWGQILIFISAFICGLAIIWFAGLCKSDKTFIAGALSKLLNKLRRKQ